MTVWTPPRFTKPLSPDFSTNGDACIAMVEKYVRLQNGQPVVLAEYERDIIRRALETYPADWPVEALRGRLRYRTFLLSIARRNHKTSIAAYLALYAVLQHGTGSDCNIVGPTQIHAGQAYKYVHTAVTGSEALGQLMKPTRSRGVARRDHTGAVRILTGDSDALQGQGFISGLWVLDEVHLMKREVYEAAVASMRSVDDGMIVCLSTAGDPDSELYLDLLGRAQRAIDGSDERFGAIILEGDKDAALDDVESIKLANPAIDAGYFSLDVALDEARSLTEPMVRRYLHNIQLETRTHLWIDQAAWAKCKGGPVSIQKGLTYAIDVSPGWSWATISVAIKVGDDVHTQIIRSWKNPTLDELKALCKQLRSHGRCTFVADGNALKPLREHIKAKGWDLFDLNGGGYAAAAQMVHALIISGNVKSAQEQILALQWPDVRLKEFGNNGEYRLAAHKNAKYGIEAVCSMAYAVYAAAVKKDKGGIAF